MSSDLVKYIDSLEIDKHLSWTPSRVSKGELKYPDHYGLLLTFKDISIERIKPLAPAKQIVWNTHKKMGWVQYRNKTENSNVFNYISELENGDPELILKKLEKELNSIKHAVFGKVKLFSKDKGTRKFESLKLEKYEVAHSVINSEKKNAKLEAIDMEMYSLLKKSEEEKLERDMKHPEKIKTTKGKVAATFKSKDDILRRKKTSQEQVVLKDPDTGKEVSNPEAIKAVSLKYCVDLLTKIPPSGEYKDHVESLKERHLRRMQEVVEDDCDELERELFAKTCLDLAKKPGSKYNFITRAGTSLRMALFNIFRIVWKTKNLPEGWLESEIIQLKKGKRFG